jgi:hypothetical protein
MILFEPLAGNGLFASHLDHIVIGLGLVLNFVYGLILGGTYRWLSSPTLGTNAVKV